MSVFFMYRALSLLSRIVSDKSYFFEPATCWMQDSYTEVVNVFTRLDTKLSISCLDLSSDFQFFSDLKT